MLCTSRRTDGAPKGVRFRAVALQTESGDAGTSPKLKVLLLKDLLEIRRKKDKAEQHQEVNCYVLS